MQELAIVNNLDLPIGFPVSFQEVREVHMLYTCAMREVRVKLENLNHEFEMEKSRNPIQHIKQRIKDPESIRKKMLRMNLPLEYDRMKKEILDIAGVRVICSYVDDIYAIVDMLVQQDDITTIRTKDYIANPKPNGYRSFHLIVMVPIFLSNKKQMIPVEIQMRTIAMDFWACLEHQLQYKTSSAISGPIRNQLKDIAEKIFDADMEMQQIYQQISSLA